MIYLFSWLKFFRITLLQFYFYFIHWVIFHTVSTYSSWIHISQNFFHCMVDPEKFSGDSEGRKEATTITLQRSVSGARGSLQLQHLIVDLLAHLVACNWILIILNFTWALCINRDNLWQEKHKKGGVKRLNLQKGMKIIHLEEKGLLQLWIYFFICSSLHSFWTSSFTLSEFWSSQVNNPMMKSSASPEGHSRLEALRARCGFRLVLIDSC